MNYKLKEDEAIRHFYMPVFIGLCSGANPSGGLA
jgi:hypothetical protein